MLLVEVEYHVACLGVDVAVHGYLAEKIAGFRHLECQHSEAVPQVVEAVEAFVQVVARLVGGLHKGAPQLDGVGQVVVDKPFAKLVLLSRRGDYAAVLATQHVGAVNETVGSHNLLILGAPHEQLFAAVGVVHEVVLVDIDFLARAAPLCGETQFAQTAYFAHDVGRQVRRGDINLLVPAVGLAQEVLLLQLFLNQFPVNGRCYVR